MGPSESDVILEIVHLNINVRDIERSLAFYTKLGFEVMHTFGTRSENGTWRIALRTRNLLNFVQQMREQGIAFESDPIEIDVVGAKRFVLFRDPDGNLLELIEF